MNLKTTPLFAARAEIPEAVFQRWDVAQSRNIGRADTYDQESDSFCCYTITRVVGGRCVKGKYQMCRMYKSCLYRMYSCRGLGARKSSRW